MHVAARDGDEELVEILLEHGASVTALSKVTYYCPVRSIVIILFPQDSVDELIILWLIPLVLDFRSISAFLNA